MNKYSNDEWVATRVGDSWHIRRRPIPLPVTTLGIIPLGLEFAVIGGVAFWLVSHPPFGWNPTFKGLGWPDIAGWVAAIVAILLYVALHASLIIGLLFTVFWTVAWTVLFYKYGLGYGLIAGAMALIGHLGIIFGLFHESKRSLRNQS